MEIYSPKRNKSADFSQNRVRASEDKPEPKEKLRHTVQQKHSERVSLLRFTWVKMLLDRLGEAVIG
ncbi:MAG: hypothetical protein KKA07_05935 [Bacteroidetes bacterium]|nr:hypothetical protein [Bacteroidota bacterium]MBU1718595.1 hypothetical protein [Bacteroidota bacterium]